MSVYGVVSLSPSLPLPLSLSLSLSLPLGLSISLLLYLFLHQSFSPRLPRLPLSPYFQIRTERPNRRHLAHIHALGTTVEQFSAIIAQMASALSKEKVEEHIEGDAIMGGDRVHLGTL